MINWPCSQLALLWLTWSTPVEFQHYPNIQIIICIWRILRQPVQTCNIEVANTVLFAGPFNKLQIQLNCKDNFPLTTQQYL